MFLIGQFGFTRSRKGAMSWKRLLIGVDDSPEAAAAAALGWRLAQQLRAECHLVHAVREYWITFAEDGLVERAAEFQLAVIASARQRMAATLGSHVPEEMIRRMTVRVGRTAVVLREVARELEADAILLGGKHHSMLNRWVGGSTSHDTVRTAGVQVLVTASPADHLFRRVLVAVDLSAAAEPTAAAALEAATVLGAELRAVSVLETPILSPTGTAPIARTAYYQIAERALQRRVWPLFEGRSVTTAIRPGSVVETIQDEAVEWGADLVVVGSHGRVGERLLLGSVTERLLNHLPTSLLVVPIGAQRLEPPKAVSAGKQRKRAVRRRGRKPPTAIRK
jgi:nucleotide-binding universal stress UspA family protein